MLFLFNIIVVLNTKYRIVMVRDRLEYYISYRGLSVRNFEKKIGAANGYVSNIKQSVTPTKQSQIAAAFPDLNMSWLLTGEGTMLRQPPSSIHDNNVIGDNNNIDVNYTPLSGGTTTDVKPIVPKYLASQPNTDVYSVVMSGEHPELQVMTTIPPYVGFDFYYMVRQDAMQPLYMIGDVVALVHMDGTNIIQGSTMVIDTRDFGFLLRRIYDRGDYYECKVINNNSAYESQNINKDNVIRLYRVMYSIRLGD